MNGKKILIVDDDRVVLKILAMKLQREGYETLLAEDGADAVRTVHHVKPDLILLDITFPPDVAHGGGVPWDGFLIMNWLRRMDEVQGIPIIMISAGEPEKYKARALAAGAIRFFHKPVQSEELLTVIRQTLEAKSADVPVAA
jgi:DNA-binding response OmpR family regulator